MTTPHGNIVLQIRVCTHLRRAPQHIFVDVDLPHVLRLRVVLHARQKSVEQLVFAQLEGVRSVRVFAAPRDSHLVFLLERVVVGFVKDPFLYLQYSSSGLLHYFVAFRHFVEDGHQIVVGNELLPAALETLSHLFSTASDDIVDIFNHSGRAQLTAQEGARVGEERIGEMDQLRCTRSDGGVRVASNRSSIVG